MRSRVRQYRGVIRLRLSCRIRINLEVRLKHVAYRAIKSGITILALYAWDCISRSQCQDVNECLSRNGGCTGECINTAGSYYCACSKDLVLAPDEKTCVSPMSRCRAMEPPLHGEVRTVARISQATLDGSCRYIEVYSKISFKEMVHRTSPTF